jgi:hypothetical protein
MYHVKIIEINNINEDLGIPNIYTHGVITWIPCVPDLSIEIWGVAYHRTAYSS